MNKILTEYYSYIADCSGHSCKTCPLKMKESIKLSDGTRTGCIANLNNNIRSELEIKSGKHIKVKEYLEITLYVLSLIDMNNDGTAPSLARLCNDVCNPDECILSKVSRYIEPTSKRNNCTLPVLELYRRWPQCR